MNIEYITEFNSLEFQQILFYRMRAIVWVFLDELKQEKINIEKILFLLFY